jgi:hypothetical protein
VTAGPRIVGLVDEQTCYLESLKEVMGGYQALPTHIQQCVNQRLVHLSQSGESFGENSPSHLIDDLW